MSKSVLIESRRRPLRKVAQEIDAWVEEGYDVIVSVGESAKPERVAKLVKFAVQNYKVDLIVRHPEFREYLENTIAGAAIGAGTGAAGVVAAIAAGHPVAAGAVLAAIGLGALLGATIGVGVTPIARITVYKHKGETRLKFSTAA